MRDAIGSDDHIDGLSRRYPLRPQKPKVLRGGKRDAPSAKNAHFKPAKKLLRGFEVFLTPEALQHLCKNHVAGQYRIAAQRCISIKR